MTPRQRYYLQASNCYAISAGLCLAPAAYNILSNFSLRLFDPPQYLGYWVLGECQVLVWLLLAVFLGLRTGNRWAIGAFGLYGLGIVALVGALLFRFLAGPSEPRWWAALLLYLLLVLGFAAKGGQHLLNAYRRGRRVPALAVA